MKFPAALRLALVPIGVAIAAKGLQYLTDESERLDAEIAARRAELVANAIRDTCPDCEREGLAHCYGKSAPEDFPPAGPSSSPPAEDPPAELHRSRPRIRVGAVVANAAAFGLGAYLSMRAQQWMQDRAAAELVRVAGAPVADAGYPLPVAEQTAWCTNCGTTLKVADAFPGFSCVDCFHAPTAAEAQAIADARRPVDPGQVWTAYAEPVLGALPDIPARGFVAAVARHIPTSQIRHEYGEPLPTEPGCMHPACILDHPHAGPAIVADPNDVG